MKKDVLEHIMKELTICYLSTGKGTPDALLEVAASIQDAIGFDSADDVHESFKLAKDVEQIPSQKSLRKAYLDVCERKHMSGSDSIPSIAYESSVDAWLPKSDIARSVNEREAIKNYCIAHSDEMYNQYVQIHVTKEDQNGKPMWVLEDSVEKFDRPIKDYLKFLYAKYIRNLRQYAHFPSDGEISLGLKTPSVNQMREMLKREGVIHA